MSSLAEVSRNTNFFLSANSWASFVETLLSLTKSHLFPTKILTTFSHAYLFISSSHWTTSLKGFYICYIIANKNTMGTTIIRRSVRTKSPLFVRIPYLEFGDIVVHTHRTHFTINIIGCFTLGNKCTLCVAW